MTGQSSCSLNAWLPGSGTTPGSASTWPSSASPPVGQAQLRGDGADLLHVAGQGDGVDAEVLRRRLPLAAQVDLDGAALDVRRMTFSNSASSRWYGSGARTETLR